MNGITAKRFFIILGLSLVLSLGIVRWHGAANVPFCIYTAGCRGDETIGGKKIIGDVKVTDYGYPLAYRHVEQFKYANPPNPNQDNETGYTHTQLASPSFSVPSIIINVVFWFALLHFLSKLFRKGARKTVKETAPDTAPTPANTSSETSATSSATDSR